MSLISVPLIVILQELAKYFGNMPQVAESGVNMLTKHEAIIAAEAAAVFPVGHGKAWWVDEEGALEADIDSNVFDLLSVLRKGLTTGFA